MDKISEITRRDIVDIIKNGFSVELDEEEYDSSSGEYITECTVIMPYSGRLDTLGFLSRLYNLKELPSHDSRYRTAYDDINCHLRWGDYEEECWFLRTSDSTYVQAMAMRHYYGSCVKCFIRQ